MSERTIDIPQEYDVAPKGSQNGLWILLAVVGLVIGAFIFLRTEPSDIGSAAELSGVLTDGQPTVIDFYSNF